MTQTQDRIGFIGAGRVASALSHALAAAGHSVVAVSSRRLDSARALAGRLPDAQAVDAPQGVVDACDLVFLTVPDATIEPLAQALRWRIGMAVVHTSGAASRQTLAAAAEQSAATGCLHPLQTFAHRDQPVELAGSVFAVEADGELRERLLALVADLGGTPLELRSEDRPLYHASAVLASNYVVTLLQLATDLWLRFGWERPAALQALLPLLRGTVLNLDDLGLPAALTGPVARGDFETVRAHLEALQAASPEALPAYRELALQTIPVALAQGGLNDAAAETLRLLLTPTSTKGADKRP